MLKKIIFAFVLFSYITMGFTQNNLNDYKYIIVPNKYEFLNESDKYQLNSLTKFLFNKYGFTAIMEDEIFPKDIVNNRCLALQSKVEKESGLLKTKLRVILKDCNNAVVYTTKLGESRQKEFSKAYNLALRDAFKSFETVSYAYAPNKNITSLASKNETSNETEVEKLKEEIKALKEEKKTKVVETKLEVVEAKPKVEKTVQQPTPTVQETPQVQNEPSDLLYAQAISNGFQLVDSSPKVVYKIVETGLSNVFFVQGRQALIYKMDGNWVLEYYEGDVLKQDVLNIKF